MGKLPRPRRRIKQLSEGSGLQIPAIAIRVKAVNVYSPGGIIGCRRVPASAIFITSLLIDILNCSCSAVKPNHVMLFRSVQGNRSQPRGERINRGVDESFNPRRAAVVMEYPSGPICHRAIQSKVFLARPYSRRLAAAVTFRIR